ncbi:pyridoxal phosphate-dependent aminotransferase [Myceligenerans pegani]|uniref:alanine transaminase n=1 Tax=Myceligenerans pegani TaxID=2776917 RepID=A0ABR9N481_9MICO|nr:pyridoxal phosphate-dependent aminotransferase [Myceligenerans sp. TRM 65318]MBE1877792.1 pyridoxal phosphate-dependent aminotransferase [Myceligenerans sp. TRM 65318]MBE3020063.1 pyridoxal phosphate-dependent aminotransferase [Myceligenerans sp. TRM 65318]
MRPITQSNKLRDVRYDVRGPILVEAERLEAEGHQVLKLNIGNPAPFGFEAPDVVVDGLRKHLREAEGYSDSRGILPAREAVSAYYTGRGLDVTPTDVFIGSGVSEMISLVLQALVDDGDEVLIPAPDYPLWTGAVTLTGGTPVHYGCDEAAGWSPDLADLESRITPHTKALVVINPNNPTGAVYPPETVRALADIARRHGLVLLSDEIYEKILFDGATHHHTATFAGDDVLCLTFSGLSKAYRVAGFRSGWVAVTGPKQLATDFLEGLTLLANMRMCANVPAQYAIPAALGGDPGVVDELLLPGGRLLEQRDTAVRLLNEIPGVHTVAPQGALYCFPRLDPAVYAVDDDEKLVLELLREKHILVTHGTGFNWPSPDHFRLVMLPRVDVLKDAIGRIADFLDTKRV